LPTPPRRGAARLQSRTDANKPVSPAHKAQCSVPGTEDKALLQLGLITLRDSATAWVRIPGMADIVGAVREARKELLRAISLSKYK
jgi:hypothetical protein